MFPCAMLRLWRNLTPLAAPKSYAATRGEGELTMGTGGTSKRTRRSRSVSGRFSKSSVMPPVRYSRYDDHRHAVTVKQAAELEDLRMRHVFPYDWPLTKTYWSSQPVPRCRASCRLVLTLMNVATLSRFEVLKTSAAIGSLSSVPERTLQIDRPLGSAIAVGLLQ